MKPGVDMLLIDPPWVVESDENLWKRVRSCLPSLGIAYIASYLEKHGGRAAILDCTAERVPVSRVGERLAALAGDPPRFVGITATTPLIRNALAIADVARSVFPGVPVILGGVHPTVEPEATLARESVDMVVRGEGERTALELTGGAARSSVLGISYKEGRRVVHNPDRPLIEDLSEIPMPAYHLLPMDRYRPAVGSYKQLPAMSLFATRGCPGRCTFCHRSFGGVTRRRSAADIFAEVHHLWTRYGVREIAFYDDTFTVFRETVEEFCRMVHSRALPLTWSCFSRVDRIDEPLLRLMKTAGCHTILFGIESADEEILRTIRKRISLERAEEVFAMCRRAGIETRASFMLGNPGETEETIRKTIDFAIRLDPDQVQFNITTVYPGTEMYEWARENGYLTGPADAPFNVSDINMRLPTLPPEVLLRYYKSAHLRFYVRPKVILRRLRRIRTLAQLRQEAAGALAVFSSSGLFARRKAGRGGSGAS